MPFVNVKLVEGVFSTEEKHELACRCATRQALGEFENHRAARRLRRAHRRL
jgi:hypothetical protein